MKLTPTRLKSGIFEKSDILFDNPPMETEEMSIISDFSVKQKPVIKKQGSVKTIHKKRVTIDKNQTIPFPIVRNRKRAETTNVEDIELKLIKEEAFDCFSSSKASDVEDAIANFYGASASDLKVSTTTLTKKSSESCKSFDKFD